MERRLIHITLSLIFVQLLGLLVEFEVIDPFGWNISKDSSTQVGFIERKERQVRRRSSSSPLWEETEKLSPLWNYDSVLTLKESSARLNLKGGTQIDLSENTLVVIDPSTLSEDAPLRLRFFKGELKALVKASNQEIQTNQWVLEPTPGAEIKVTSMDPDKLEVEVSGGEVRMFASAATDTSSVPLVLSSGERVEIAGAVAQEPVKMSQQLRWLSGDHLRIYSHSEPVEVSFEWEGEASQLMWLTKEGSEVSELSRDQKKFVLPSVHYGVYRARLKSLGQEESRTLKVEVWKASKHYLTSPLPRDRARTQNPVMFSWTPNALAEKYRLSFAERARKADVVKEKSSLTKNELITPDETGPLTSGLEGNFWWQVEAIDSEGFVIPAHYAQEIYFLENPLAPPVLIAPAIRAPGSAK